MYKVVIIDDEPIVRKGIVNIINWSEIGCEVVGEAADGEQGMALIDEKLPDIILTDIHMPEMDGLEMIKKTIDKIPWSKIIVLTGYREFDYIQEALKLGASDYLLKPSKIDEITTAVRKACLELDFKKKRDKNVKALEEHFNRSLPLLKEKLLFDVAFSSHLNEKEVEEELELYDLNIHEFVLVALDISYQKSGDIYQKQLLKIGIKNVFVDIFSDQYICHSMNVTQSRLAFIIQPNKMTNHFVDEVVKKIESFQVVIKSCFDQEIIIGISSKGEGWQSIFDKMKECEKSLSYKMYFSEDALILYDDIKNLALISDDSDLLDIKKDIVSAIKIGNQNLLSDLNTSLLEKTTHLMTYRQVYKTLIADIKEVSQVEVVEIDELMTVKECFEVYQNIADSKIQQNKDHNIKNLSLVLKQSLEYIQNNYQESISLQDVADYTYVSIYYLSRMFKKEIGKNFVDYLNEYRMKKATHYLKDYELKTYEVAELVGISDPHYFSKLFKKYMGETPTEYRNKL